MVSDSKIIPFPGSNVRIEPHGFYLPDQAARIARVPRWTLNAWRREGIVLPTTEWENAEGKKSVGYNFDTLVFLRLIRMLREDEVALHKAVETVQQLVARFGKPGPAWEEARIVRWGSEVFVYRNDEWQTTVATQPKTGQRIAEVLFGDEFTQLLRRADALLIPRRFQKHVEVKPEIRNGLPVVIGTTILTSVIHALRDQNLTYKQIHDEFPSLSIRRVAGADSYESFLDKEGEAA